MTKQHDFEVALAESIWTHIIHLVDTASHFAESEKTKKLFESFIEQMESEAPLDTDMANAKFTIQDFSKDFAFHLARHLGKFN